MKRILVIGGYGNFGRFISKVLAAEADIELVIGGRNLAKAQACCAQLNAVNPAIAVRLDIENGLAESLHSVAPDIVIHTSGPFQNQGYGVAQACIQQGCHYIDLADGREFVANIHALHDAASQKGVLVCSGASSVPGLSSALIQHYQGQFQRLEEVDYAISTAHKTSRGLATTKAVLSYAGARFMTLEFGQPSPVIGWRGTRKMDFWKLGPRLLGNCDIPDLSLFPQQYPNLQRVHFQAGLELPLIHRVLAMMAWMTQHHLLPNLQHFATIMMRVSEWFDFLGSENSGFFMTLSGPDHTGKPLKIRFDLIAREGHGLYIPTVPAIVLALKLARQQITKTGAFPCIGFVSLDEYLQQLSPLNIEWRESC